MGRTAGNSVYVTGPTLVKVAMLARQLTEESGRRVTFGEAVEHAVVVALNERAREGAST